jgi:uncharacterized protein (DUF2132 family)
VNASDMRSFTKQVLLNSLEDNGWKYFLEKVKAFCFKYKVKIPDMDTLYKPLHRSKWVFKKVNNLHRLRVDIFLGLIDRQYQELENRINEVNTELLVWMSSLNPVDSFAAYDRSREVGQACSLLF